MVRGSVPSALGGRLESEYESIGRGDIPPGLETSFLLRSADGSVVYAVVTVWTSREDLQAMRSREKPKAVALFEKFGVAPTVEIHDVVATTPSTGQ